MGKFEKKRGKATPVISTASLPDIIFILLFFFMVVTVMRETERMVDVTVPKATELEKLQRKSLVSYIYIGPPIKKYAKILGTAPQIQLEDAFATKEDIGQFIEKIRTETDEKLIPLLTTSLRVDRKVTMGIVSDVKQELRKANALKINYSATPRDKVY